MDGTTAIGIVVVVAGIPMYLRNAHRKNVHDNSARNGGCWESCCRPKHKETK